jgi:hypothetical protein
MKANIAKMLTALMKRPVASLFLRSSAHGRKKMSQRANKSMAEWEIHEVMKNTHPVKSSMEIITSPLM